MRKRRKPCSPRDGTPEVRYVPRGRLLIVGLVLLILGPFLFYAWVAVRSAREMARHNALVRDLAAAQLGARLMDEQCDAALSLLSSLAERPALVAAIRRLGDRADDPGARIVEQHLRYAVELVPELALVAAYRPDGRLLTSYSYPTHLPAPAGNARREDWFRGIMASGRPYVSHVSCLPDPHRTPVVSLAVPVGSARHPIAYLMAPYRLEVIDAWLRPLRTGAESVLYAVDAGGHPVARSGGLSGGQLDLAGFPAVRLAMAGRHGTLQWADPDGTGEVLVGYAPARVPRWAVVVLQPVEAAFAPADHLLRRLSFLVFPLLALMTGAGWSIEWLYRQQVRLARENAALSRDLSLQNEQLHEADRAKSEFLANVSHDLRTPLASIKASVSALLEPAITWDPGTLREFLTLVNEETDRLTARVRNLLDMARLEGRALPMQAELCDLTDIVASALERMEPLTRGRAIGAAFPPEPLPVEVDYAQIETVVINLLENAVKYSPAGSRLHLRGEIVARSWVAAPDEEAFSTRRGPGGDSFARFALQDEGPGVRPGDEDRIFEKFYRAVASSSVGGTGLGLAICKAIVEAHGGAIGVRRAPRGGAEFWFALPLCPEPDDGPSGAEGGEQILVSSSTR
jgi:signal transduction histidine kinase